MKKRLLSFLLTVFLVLPLIFSSEFMTSVGAIPSSTYKYQMRIETRDEKDAGTSSDIYCGFVTYNDGVRRLHLDEDGFDDFERGDIHDYYLDLYIYPWMVSGVHLHHKGGGTAPGWMPGRVWVWLPKMSASQSPSVSAGMVTFSGTMQKGDTKELDISSGTRRNFTSLGSFDNWGRSIYLGKGDSGTLSLSWNGNTTDQYGTYNIFAYDDAGTFSFTNSFNTGTSTLFTNNFTKPNSSTSANLNLTYSQIYNEMVAKGIGKATLTFKLSVPARSSNAGSLFTSGSSSHTHTETVTIYRKCFDLGAVSYSETPVFTARKDNDYLNNGKKNVTLTVAPSSIHCSDAMSDDEIKQLVNNFTCSAALYSGNGTSTKLCNLSYKPSADGKKLVFTGTVPSDFSSNGAGVNLCLTNVSSKYNGNTYYLNSGSTTWNNYISTLKVDTKKPTVSITDKDGIALDITNKLAPSHTFHISGSETLYKSNTAPHPDSDEAYLNYSLMSGDTKVAVNNYNGSSGSYLNVTVPVSTSVMADLPITLKTAEKTEGNYSLVFNGYDDAGNIIANNTIENVLLDCAAPRYTLADSREYQDAQLVKHVEYDFNLTDICNGYRDTLGSYSRLYYVFVPNGAELPAFDTEHITGEIDTTVGKWNFVEADDDGKTPTILLTLKLEENFKGDLYILTKDSVGNTSETVKFASGLDIYNYETTDTIVTSSTAVPKKSFDISFVETVDGFDGIFETEYRWVPISVNARPIDMDFVKYEGEDVGAGTQYGKDGEPVVLDGTYMLEYRVTETRSHNSKTYTKNYIFDNLAPEISVAWETGNEKPLQLQQATVGITDVSGVKEAYWEMFTADGEYVTGGELTPYVGGDGKVTVHESIKLQPEQSGVYYIEVTAEDVNGDIALHDTSDMFEIRRGKPSVISAGDDIDIKIEGVSVTSDNEYTVYLQVNEDMICANELTADQYVKYRVSSDGVNFSAWTVSDVPMEAYRDTLSAEIGIVNPIILTEGENTVYINVACAEKGNTADPAATLVGDTYKYKLIYDTTAPDFDTEYSTYEPTADDVTVDVAVNDANGITEIVSNNALVSVTKENDAKYTLTVRRNVDTTVTLTDAVGNSVKVPVTVANIDKDAPEISGEIDSFDAGARTDAAVTVLVEDANATTERFALVKDPEDDSEVDAAAFELFDLNKYKFAVEKATVDGGVEYTITIRGLDGTYGLAVESTDSLGNTYTTAADEIVFTAVDAEADITAFECDPEISKTTATVDMKFNVPLAVLDPSLATGDSDAANELNALNMPEKVYVTEYSRTVNNSSEHKLYAVDEANRTYTLTFTPTTVFIEGFKTVTTLYKNGEVIENGSFIAFEEDDEATLVIEANPVYSLQYFDITAMKLSGLELDTDACVKYVPEGGKDEGKLYTKLVFNVLHDTSTSKSVSFVSYTEEGLEADRYQNETVIVSVFDETAPTIEFTPSVINDIPTNKDVTVSAVFGDAQSGIAMVERIIDGGDAVTLDSTVRDSVVFTENGKVTYIITNNAGLTYTASYKVKNVDKTPVTEGEHFRVDYCYENYLGKWKPVKDGMHYRAVKAVVTFEDCDKELFVANNAGSEEVILTKDKGAFTFVVADTAGNTTEKQVSWENFDTDAPSVEWSLSNYNKTNKPVTAFVTITDKDGVNDIVYAEVRDADGELIEWEDEVLGDEYRVSLPLSGNYLVRAYDAAGNMVEKQIVVSNIDVTKPVITSISYSTPPTSITTRSVLVTIEEFSKSGVTVTGVELADNLDVYDVSFTPGGREFRFKKSGYISVFFIDEYGNENASVISVSNIYTEPPALEAVATLSEDKLSVEISFVKQYDKDGMPIDKYRELSDLCVVYDGVTYTTDKTFKIKQNGDYTFTVFDEAGTSQTIKLTVTDIDDKAPVIKTVSWSYEYNEENGGVWEKKTYEHTIEIGKDTSGTEAGYTVATDVHKVTNSDVTVTVVTDKDTSILGSDAVKSTANSLIYAENGLFTFNLAAYNGTVASYGVDVAVIDKTAPTLDIEGANELIFIEGMTSGKDPEFVYDKSRFYDFTAYDVFEGVRTELTDKVVIDFGDFDPDNIDNNVFDRTKPYYVTYRVYDDAGNMTEIRRTVRLIGFYDTVALINGKMPNSANSIAIKSDTVEISLKNFGGSAYARIAEGIKTMGQMKTTGTPITPYNGKLSVEGLKDGWYTVYIQTDKRDYFTITVFVDAED